MHIIYGHHITSYNHIRPQAVVDQTDISDLIGKPGGRWSICITCRRASGMKPTTQGLISTCDRIFKSLFNFLPDGPEEYNQTVLSDRQSAVSPGRMMADRSEMICSSELSGK